MHGSVMAFVGREVEKHRLREKTCLDVGSYDVNGSVRGLFNGSYTGVDMRAGPNVDHVVNAHDLVPFFGSGVFDVVVCCEMLEHDPAFWMSMRQMGAVLRPGGRLILTTRGLNFPLHEYPDDLWRFTPSAGHVLAELAGLDKVEVKDDPQASGIFLTGVKP